VAACLCAAVVAAPQPRPGVNGLLKQAATYVRQFEKDFSAIVTDESYDQHVAEGAPHALSTMSRHIQSEMLFMRVPGEGLSWLSARNVLEVDGDPIADSRDRLERAIKGDRASLAERLQSVADEGARFNIGRIQRNVNDPILPLLFLDPEYQARFKFRLEKDEDLDGVRLHKLSFKERARPTIIGLARGGSLYSSGAVWLRAEDAVVVRTELGGRDGPMSFTIRVEYERNPKLDMWIPARMEERYRNDKTNEQVDCLAVYTNARRFETSGRVVK
jgi:hypothetical protein